MWRNLGQRRRLLGYLDGCVGRHVPQFSIVPFGRERASGEAGRLEQNFDGSDSDESCGNGNVGYGDGNACYFLRFGWMDGPPGAA